MEIEYTIIYKEEVMEIDIPKLDSKNKELIKNAIKNKLTKYPEIFGKPLRRSLSGTKKLRVGNYRVVFEISKNKIIIWAIGHRKNIYFIANKRLS